MSGTAAPDGNTFSAWMNKHRNQLVVAGLVVICLGVDLIALRSALDYALNSGALLLGLYLAIFVPLTVAVPLLWYLIFVKRTRPELIFLIAASVFGLLLLLVRTPYTWFDEYDHAYLALYYSDVALGAEHDVDADGKLRWTGRAEDANNASDSFAAFTDHNTTANDYRLMAENFFALEQNPGQMTTLTANDVGRFYQYIPAALGVTVAKLLHLGKVPTLYLGKLFSLAFYILMLCLVIRIAPQRFKTLFILLGLIPFVLSSAGTFSYDNLINILSFMFIAYVLRLACVAKQVRARDIAALAVIGTLLIPLKYVYFPLVFLAVIIPKEKWPRPHFRVFWCLGILALGCLACAALALGDILATLTQASANQSLSEGYPDSYTLKTLFEHPMTALRVLGNSAVVLINDVVYTNSGFDFSSRLPVWTSYLVFVLLLVNSGARGSQATSVLRSAARGIILAIATLIFLLVLLASVAWTPVGATLLAGVQGRYFVPLLPLLALAFSGCIETRKDLSRASIYLFCCLSAVEAFFTFISIL